MGVHQLLQSMNFTDYVDEDGGAMVCGNLTEGRIVHVVDKESAAEDKKDDEEGETLEQPCASQVR